MRLVTFREEAVERLGFLLDDRILDPQRTADHAGEPAYGSAVAFIRAGDAALRAAERLIADAPASALVPLSKVTLTAPMRPSTLLCSGSNYRDHNKEKANTPISGKEPEFFVKTADSVVGPGEHIIYDPALTRKLDCETELAIVIGKPGRHIPAASALDHVFGYTIVNDVTARDRQVRRSPEGSVWYDLGRGKSFDTSAPLGPCIVTSDEIIDPQNLKLETRINGDLRQSSTTAEMIWTCAELIHFFSSSFTLRPGMVIITGTPAGTAWSTDPELGGKWQALLGLVPASRYCLPGDRIESTIEHIGVLRNDVVRV
jgi:2-keto-4-pentenoate hydratase/2-oxohepta-3-ene-1,7-dioic acid hydratase in catechol pathway